MVREQTRLTEAQKQEIQWSRYLVEGINYNHALNWYNEIKRTKGQKAANEFKKRVNWINERKILN